MFLLVLARMAGLVRKEERSVARERALRLACVALVGAARIDEIEDAATAAIRSSPARDAEVRLITLHEDPAEDRISARAREWLTAVAATSTEAVRWVDVKREVLDELASRRDGSNALLALKGRSEGTAFVIASIPGFHGPEMQGALEALAALFSLAIDGARAAEEAHRGRSEARFRALLEHSSDLIAVLDRAA